MKHNKFLEKKFIGRRLGDDYEQNYYKETR